MGMDTTVTRTGLSLIHGITYYVSVKATDNLGNEGDYVATDGITVDELSIGIIFGISKKKG